MGFEGKFDKETETLEVSGAGMDIGELDRALKWMMGIRRFLDHRRIMDNGGHRWEFQRGIVPMAQLMRGKEVWVRPFPLVPIKPRRARKCTACGVDIEASAACWRPAPGSWSGHSRDRFCERCVERGAAPRPPTLRLVV